MNNFIELLGLKMNEYDIHDGDALLLYKNMGGIYIIYNDITKEVYIGKSQNLGQRIEQHKESHNYVVKDLVKKPYTKIYVGVMSNADYDKYSTHLEAFAIIMFSIV